MKRIGVVVAAGVLVLASVLPSWAQGQPQQQAVQVQGLSQDQNATLQQVLNGPVTAGNVHVTFGGAMRVYGWAFNNTTDFTNTGSRGEATKTGGTCVAASGNNTCSDNSDFFFQRFRLFTTMESADHKAGAYWALEIGDLVWGQGGGASGGEWNACGQSVTPGINTTGGGPNQPNGQCANSGFRRVGNGSGASLGADGVNVETKNLYLWFEIPGLPNSKLLAGIHDVLFLVTDAGGFFDDDAAGLQFTWKADPFDLVAEWARLTEQNTAQSMHNDMYILRLGANVTPDWRVTLEYLMVNSECIANVAVPASAPPSAKGPFTCVRTSLGKNSWLGATFAGKIGGVSISGAAVGGQREQVCAGPQPDATTAGILCNSGNPAKSTVRERGAGFIGHASVPIGPITVYGDGWYATGDSNRPITGGIQQNSNVTLTKSSSRLPTPESGASWGNGSPFVAEFLLGSNTIGAPEVGQGVNYLDISGTWGVGGSALYALTPAFSFGGGVAVVGASSQSAKCPGVIGTTVGGTPDCPVVRDANGIVVSKQGNIYGHFAIEADAGFIWKFNPNLTITGIAGGEFPDSGDNAWAVAVRTQYAF